MGASKPLCIENPVRKKRQARKATNLCAEELGAEEVGGPKIRNWMRFEGVIYLYKSCGIY